MTVPVHANPLVRAAVRALDDFGAMDRWTANELLTMWARRAQLTPPEVAAVLEHFPRNADDADDALGDAR